MLVVWLGLPGGVHAGPKVSARLPPVPSAPPHARVEILSTGGRVNVLPSRSGRIEVDGVQVVEARDAARADALLSELRLSVEADSSAGLWRLEVVPPPVRRPRLWDALLGRIERIEVELRVGVPAATQVTVRSDEAAIAAEGLQAPFRAGTGAGDVFLRQLGGGAWVVAQGRVRLEEVHGTSRIEAFESPVEIRRCTGPIDVRTRSGDVLVSDLEGALTVQSGSGSLRLQRGQGNVRFASASGRAVVEAVSGSFDVQTASGDVDVEILPRPGHDYAFHTANGDVVVRVAGGADLRVDAFTARGALDVRLPGWAVAKHTEREYRSQRGEDGPRLWIRSSAGDLRIQTVPPGP